MKNLCAFSVTKNILFVLWITFIKVNIYTTYIYIFNYITFSVLQSTLKTLPVFLCKTAYITQSSEWPHIRQCTYLHF